MLVTDLSKAQDLYGKLQTARKAEALLKEDGSMAPLSVRIVPRSGTAVDLILSPDGQGSIRERCLADTQAIITFLTNELALLGVIERVPAT